MAEESFEILIMLMLAFLLVVLVVFLIRVPIIVAKSRNVSPEKIGTIALLSWLGLLFGVTWVVALILALIWTPNILANEDSLGQLEKAAKLYKDKIITKAEFDKIKSELLNK